MEWMKYGNWKGKTMRKLSAKGVLTPAIYSGLHMFWPGWTNGTVGGRSRYNKHPFYIPK